MKIAGEKFVNAEVLISMEPGKLASFVNPFSYSRIRDDNSIISGIDYFGVDGWSLLPFVRYCTRRPINRASFDFTSIADAFFERAQAENLSLYIIGSDPDSIEKFIVLVVGKYPRLKISGWRHGFFTNSTVRNDVIESIVSTKPDLILCGMGGAIQEKFLIDAKKAGWYGFGITCGGFLHQSASRGVAYYPRWVDQFNLRFLYRMYDEPKLLKRYFFDYWVAFFLILMDIKKR